VSEPDALALLGGQLLQEPATAALYEPAGHAVLTQTSVRAQAVGWRRSPVCTYPHRPGRPCCTRRPHILRGACANRLNEQRITKEPRGHTSVPVQVRVLPTPVAA
jgi:hypothetical protein